MEEEVQYVQTPQFAELPAPSTGYDPADAFNPLAEPGGEFLAVSNMNFGTKTGGWSIFESVGLASKFSCVGEPTPTTLEQPKTVI